MLPFLASLFGMAIPGMTAAGTAAAGTAGTAAAGTAGSSMFPDMASMFGGGSGGGQGSSPMGSGGGGGQDDAEALKLAQNAMNSAAAGAKPAGSPMLGMRYGPQQQIDLSQLMAVLQNRSRLG
jgi:hypothetical protein